MSMRTYIKAGEVHIGDDDEIGVGELRSNQRRLNAHVSMLLKVCGAGKDNSHSSRWRESMLNNSLETCPLWLLFKCHKGWNSSKGTPPPTRPVAGGNQGMNLPLSTVISWALEPLADSLMKSSSEVISNEDMKSRFDKLNKN